MQIDFICLELTCAAGTYLSPPRSEWDRLGGLLVQFQHISGRKMGSELQFSDASDKYTAASGTVPRNILPPTDIPWRGAIGKIVGHQVLVPVTLL